MYVWLIGAVVVLLSGMGAYMWHHQAQTTLPEPVEVSSEATTTPRTPMSTDETGVFTLALNETGESHGWSITPTELVIDSRCPVDVQCIHAGTVEVRVRIGSSTTPYILTLAEPKEVAGGTVTLVQVTPEMRSTARIALSGYRFSFLVTSK